MDLLLNDKAALVTGGGRGIGQAIAVALARQGVHVAVCGRTRVPLEATAALVETHGVKSAVIVADLLDPDGCRRAVEETASSFGRLDILISNASTNVDGHPADLEGVTDAQLMERVNGKGMASVRVTRAALPHLRASGQGQGHPARRYVSARGGRPRRRVCERSRQCLRRQLREASQRRRRAGRHHGERDPSRSDEDGSPPAAHRGARRAPRRELRRGRSRTRRRRFRSDGWSRPATSLPSPCSSRLRCVALSPDRRSPSTAGRRPASSTEARAGCQ